jgi:transketolase
MVSQANSSHIGSCYSMADLVAVLYDEILNIDPVDPNWSERDRFILSKGHACAVIYAALAEKNFFSKTELETYAQEGSPLMAHISHRVPGVEFSTGSLGHGLPFAIGKALGAKMKKEQWHTFVMLGDGEMDEGSNWEGLLFAAHHKLSNVTAIIDMNNLQSLTTTGQTLNLEPLDEKLAAFGAEVFTIDGHDYEEIFKVLTYCKNESTRPTVILAKTIKGKGVDFMENKVEWHYRSPNAEQLAEAIAQLEGAQ